MKLRQLLQGIALRGGLPAELNESEVSGLAYDSRRVGPGFLFFAFPGSKVDGRVFARDAASRGALAVASELPRPDDFDGAWIQVEHGRRALATAARSYFGKPDEALKVAAVTGTNGKTTTAILIDRLLTFNGARTALIGTIEYHIGGRRMPAVNTTPESLDLFQIFREHLDEGGSHVAMEASSHALELGRFHGVQVQTAIFTNLTRDHLDFHGNMESYFAAKQKLFAPVAGPSPKFAVINHDDEWGRKIQPAHGVNTFWYGVSERAPIRAINIETGFEGLRFTIRTPDGEVSIASPLTARFNVHNILAAFCTGLSMGLEAEAVARGITTCDAVPGRFQTIQQGQPFLVAVDYAHTDDAIRNLIQAARGLNPKRVITLYGCGGDRDRTKRPLMGRASGEGSDFVVVTSDNPRSEDPLAIIEESVPGVRETGTPYLVEPDREEAIRKALQMAQPGDAVLLAGKGHETYQILKSGPIAFDDREVARRVLSELGFGGTK